MSPNTLRQLRDWLTIGEAAGELSAAMSETVKAADVLRLAIDGHLKLSIYLPANVTAKCKRRDDAAAETLLRQQTIQGLCDLPMIGRGRLQIEHEYQHMHGVYVPMDGPVGALVAKDNLVCQLPPDHGARGMSTRAASEFPTGSVLAVRRSALQDFITRQAQVTSGRSPEVLEKPVAEQATSGRTPGILEKPVAERERATLLTIIAALAKSAAIDVTKPAKAAETIEGLTIDLGARVSARTVANHLNRIPDALERRKKHSA